MKCSDAMFGVIYVLAGFATFAWIQVFADIRYDPDRNAGSVLGGIFWPVYWTGKGFLDGAHALQEANKHRTAQCVDPASGRTWEAEAGYDNVYLCRIGRGR